MEVDVALAGGVSSSLIVSEGLKRLVVHLIRGVHDH